MKDDETVGEITRKLKQHQGRMPSAWFINGDNYKENFKVRKL